MIFFLFFQLSLAQQVQKKPSTRNWSLGGGGGWFGIPVEVMEIFVYKSPKLEGETYALKIAYDQGQGGFLSTTYLFSLIYARMSGSGGWQHKENSEEIGGDVDFTQYGATMSLIVNLFDFSSINPYLGVGLGVGIADVYVKGQLVEDIDVEEEDDFSQFVPVLCLPVGLRLKFKNMFNIKIEGGFQNGFYVNGFLSIYF